MVSFAAPCTALPPSSNCTNERGPKSPMSAFFNPPSSASSGPWQSSSDSSEDLAPKSPLSAFFNPAPTRQLTVSCQIQSPMSAYFNPRAQMACHIEYDSFKPLRGLQIARHARPGGANRPSRMEDRFWRKMEQYRLFLGEPAATGSRHHRGGGMPSSATSRCKEWDSVLPQSAWPPKGSQKEWAEKVEPLPGSSSERSQTMPPQSVQSWRVPQRYQLGSLLGSGAYSVVCEAWDHKEGRGVAIKKVQGLFQSGAFTKRILREVAILSHMDHEHVVRILDLPRVNSPCSEDLYIVTERCDTDFQKVCAHLEGVSMPQARKLSYGLLSGCSYLHAVGIYHRDLKPANCLVSWDCHVRICDFNLSRTVAEDPSPAQGFLHASLTGRWEERSADRRPSLKRTLTAHVATRWYRSPEVILQLPYSGAMDVWSAGCIIAELFLALNEGGRTPKHGALFPGRECYAFSHATCGDQTPHWAADPGDQLDLIFDVLGTPSSKELEVIPSTSARAYVGSYFRRPGIGLRACVPAEAGEDGLQLLGDMLRLLPGERSSAAQALQHPFFSEVRRPWDEEFGIAPEKLDIGFDEAELEQTV